MTYALQVPIAGAPQVNAQLPATAPGNVLPWPPIPIGYRTIGYDPVFGYGEFIFAKASGTIRQYGLCSITPTLNSTTRQYEAQAAETANTANTARPCFVCMTDGGLAANQFGWLLVAGFAPINGTASVAAGVAVGVTAAGQIGASSAGKEVEGMVSILAATNTVVRAAVAGVSGANTIQLHDVDGLFVGGFVAGTGVGASAVISAIDPITNTITVTVVNSAAVTGNVTQTANNGTIFYNVCQLEGPSVQGRIT